MSSLVSSGRVLVSQLCHILSSFPVSIGFACLISSHLISLSYLILSYFISSYLMQSVQAELSFAPTHLPLAPFSLRLLSSLKLLTLASKSFDFVSRALSHLLLYPSSSLVFASRIAASHLILSSFISSYRILSCPSPLVFISAWTIVSALILAYLISSYLL